MLFSKAKTLEAENESMKQAIDLMRVDLQDMNTNEQALVEKVRDIDAQNQRLLEESTSLNDESLFYKDKARQFEIQLNQAIANERILNENLRSSDDRNRQLQETVSILRNKGTKEFDALTQEAEKLQTELNSIARREMVMQSNLKSLEAENFRLNSEINNSQDRERDYKIQISVLNQNNNNLIQQIDSTQKMRVRLRNDIMGVIDQNDQGQSGRYIP
jgi:chromosome segregation ATPase